MNDQTLRVSQSKAVATSVNAAEQSISIAIRDGALAIASIMDASIAIGFAAEVGNGAVAGLMGGVNQLVSSRTQFIEAHRDLAAIGRKIGLAPTDWGDGSAKNADLRPATTLLAVA